jgi:DNA-binding CsgD family transcriptional regulator
LSIFDIDQGNLGEMYFATSSGLLLFDGVRWKNFVSGSESDLRAVFYKDENHIYTSGHGGFGYWSKQADGRLAFTRLYFKEPQKDDPLLPVFSGISEVDNKILFQTFQQIFIYDPEQNSLDSIAASRGFKDLISTGDRSFIQDFDGLYEISDNKLNRIESSNPEALNIVGIIENSSSQLIVITKNGGFWLLENGLLTKLNWPIGDSLESYLINTVQQTDNGTLILGTARNGVYLVSNTGKLILHLNKIDGIAKNNISKVFQDSNKNIWLGMQHGLSYIQTNGQLNYLIDVKGEYGTVYTTLLKDSLLYMGTDQGLFVLNWKFRRAAPKLIDKEVGQIWTLQEVDNQILVGSHQGVSILENNKLNTIHKEGGAWLFRKHPRFDNLLYVGFYSGIAVFKKENNKWVFLNKWQNYGESSRFMEFDKFDNLWVSHPSKGYYRLNLSDNGEELDEVEFYGTEHPLVSSFAYFSKLDNDIVFFNPNGYFQFDPISNNFISADYYASLFDGLAQVNSIFQFGDIFWFSTAETIGYVVRDDANFYNVNAPFNSLKNRHLNDFNKFNRLNDSVFGIGIKDGMVFHTIKDGGNTYDLRSPEISHIYLLGTSDTLYGPVNQVEEFKIPYKNNSIKIGLSYPGKPISYPQKVQYRLIGYSDKWSGWEYLSEISLPGLAPGKYILELQSRGENRDTSVVVQRKFHVMPPWYLSKLAIGLFICFMILVNIVIRGYFKTKSKRQIEILKIEEEEKRKRQKDAFELAKLESERKMLVLKEENLNLEIKKKNSELASSTLNNIKKNDLLIELIDDIKSLDREVLNSSLHSPIKRILKKINSHLTDKDDWLTFELHFRSAHSDFFEKLRAKHPDLSSNEIKLCAYLKLNLSSKEIASLMNISIRSVEQGRWRLRNKLNLQKEIGLVNYIQTF